MAEIANVDQAAAWDGVEGDEWTENEERRNASLRAHTVHLFDAASIGADEHVLDVGCGCGETTREAATRATRGDVLGIDLSARMLERARDAPRESGLENVRFEQADAQVHPFTAEAVDVVISRFGVMFFGDPVATFSNIGAGVKRGGRLALIVWQELARNEWVRALRGALAMGRDLPTPPANAPGPFGLAAPEFVRDALGAAGFAGIELEDVQAPFWFGSDAEDAFVTAESVGIVRGLLEDLTPEVRAEALDALRDLAAAHETPDGVTFDSRCWIITARRT